MGSKSYFFFSEPKKEEPKMVGLPDVYWDGKPEHNLADDPLTGKPRVFGSKAEKARYLQQRGLSEAGDRVHGGYASAMDVRHTTVDDRTSALKALQHVKQMGRDVRRQEYLRIVKEGQRHDARA